MQLRIPDPAEGRQNFSRFFKFSRNFPALKVLKAFQEKKPCQGQRTGKNRKGMEEKSRQTPESYVLMSCFLGLKLRTGRDAGGGRFSFRGLQGS